MTELIPVALEINGMRRAAMSSAGTTLLQVLRDQFQLNGAKRGCNVGTCGACNVLIDGCGVRSCLTLALDVEGCDITTIEGLGHAGALGPVQQAFVDTGAIQCGFCMPGMIISAAELLSQNLQPTRDEIRGAIAGNLCRCSGYVKVIDAIALAAQRMSVAKEMR